MSWGRAEASIVDTGYQRDMRPSWVSPLLHVAHRRGGMSRTSDLYERLTLLQTALEYITTHPILGGTKLVVRRMLVTNRD